MNPRTLVRAATPLAVIVLTTGGSAADCERQRTGSERESSSRYTSRVEIRADGDTCWTASLDGKTHRGCGDATLYGHGKASSDHRATVVKVDGNGSVRASLVVGGRTVDRGTARSSGSRVEVHQEVRSG